MTKVKHSHKSPKRIGAIRTTNKSGQRVWIYSGKEFSTAGELYASLQTKIKSTKEE